MADDTQDWLSGGGEMGALIRSIDWGKTPLGPVQAWPQSLRTTVSLCLSSTFPILIAWGSERVQIYNDAYRPICGEKHPAAMGQEFNVCWASALPAVGGIVDRAQAGEGSYLENLPMFLDRYGYLEEAFMTFSFSPIRDESGGVGGLFHPITEVTEKMLGGRRTQALRGLAAHLGTAKSLPDVRGVLGLAHANLELDLPFLLFYELNEDGERAVCSSAAGLPIGSPACPDEIVLGRDQTAVWPIGDAIDRLSIVQLDDARARLGAIRCGPYPESPTTALLIPIQPAGAPRPLGCLVAGVSARRALDASYRSFFEQLGATVTTAATGVLALAEEQRRVEALAEIDRAKTAFFSNVSHEFRTPLALMLGPLEDALDDATQPLPSGQRERVALVQRNGMRLLKLVNTLLDFSRIEAGRVLASFEATDLGALTRELASVFRSTVERAGLALHVHCEPSPEATWVDREMWEKIVLNLLSNAFKHTFAGAITVRLVPRAAAVELAISDTGIGIPAKELPRLFERFHRVEGARGRSYEGSGIGLALVQELVKLHGGSIRVDSELERGTTVTITLPTGSAHLDPARLGAGRATVSTATRAEAFVHEAASWVEGPEERLREYPTRPTSHAEFATPPDAAPPRVLLADDNADMREYVRRVLQEHFVVETVADGRAALSAARERLPDLIVSDVMMPVLDGFGLLSELKADPTTAEVPVILLSARAGEEATLEGLQAGASDYMVKPFSARELSARVEGAIRTARAQLEVKSERARLAAVLAALHEGVIFQDRSGVARYCNAAAERLLGLSEEQLAGRTSMDPRWRAIFEDGSPAPGDQHAPVLALRTGQPVIGQLLGIPRAGEANPIWLRVNAQPIFEADGQLVGVATSFFDITAELEHAREVRVRAEFEQQLIGIVSHDLRNPLNAVLLGSNLLLGREGINESNRKLVQRIRNSTDRAIRLVRDLLDFTQARLGSGIMLTRDRLDLGASVEHAIDEVRNAFPGREVVEQVAGPLIGMWDADRVGQIVHNLVSNAIKYGRSDRPVTVRLHGSTHEVTLEVHNQGKPIAAELLPRIFQPLTRGGGADDRTRSIGLGLFIVDEIVRAHGGTVGVTSTDVNGTTFSVLLPYDQGD